jgi:hypothetical protein
MRRALVLSAIIAIESCMWQQQPPMNETGHDATPFECEPVLLQSQLESCFIPADGSWVRTVRLLDVRPATFAVSLGRPSECSFSVFNLEYDADDESGSVLRTQTDGCATRTDLLFKRRVRSVPTIDILPDGSVLLNYWYGSTKADYPTEYKSFWVPLNGETIEVGSCKDGNLHWQHALRDDGTMIMLTPYACTYEHPCHWGQTLLVELRPDGTMKQRCTWLVRDKEPYSHWMLRPDGREFGACSGSTWTEGKSSPCPVET